MLLDALLLVLSVSVALALRPWHGFTGRNAASAPWPWFALWACLPLLWSTDLLVRAPLLQPLSAAPLLALMAGWPLAMLALPPAALIALTATGMSFDEALHRAVWLGAVPGTLALGIGLAVRRLLPMQLFVYILGRAFLGTWIALTLTGALALWARSGMALADNGDLMLARFLAASAEAALTGMLVSIFVAYRPQWLATWSDRLYLAQP